MTEIHEFEISVGDDVLADLRRRLREARWPNEIDGAGWTYGTDLSYLRGLCDYWADGFDWRAWEAKLNRWTNIRTEIFGDQIHAIVARSPHDNAMPLLLTHGWPGSVVRVLAKSKLSVPATPQVPSGRPSSG